MNITIAPPQLLADPEANAMMQAFYSRSKRGINDRLAETTLDPQKIKDALRQYYVGYGHDSIGQCGFTTIFIEDVSLPAIKAIQDNDLFNGQESSTRYIDYSSGALVEASSQYMDIMEQWVALYMRVKDEVKDALGQRYREEMLEKPVGDFDEDLWAKEVAKFDKACEVKAFDIAGAFLPAGITSNTSWTTSLATLNRELLRLANHPMLEVRQIAKEINAQVKIAYPSIWKPLEDSDYIAVSPFAYSPVPGPVYAGISINVISWADSFSLHGLAPRPKYARMPRILHNAAHIRARVTMDYRSFRDVQRHRPLHPTIPLLTADFGTARAPSIHGWYLEVLGELGVDVREDIHRLYRQIFAVPGTSVEKQYLYPLGQQVTFDMIGALGDWVYFCELRTGETVHPTVREMASSTWNAIEQNDNIAVLSRDINAHVKPGPTLEESLRPSFRRAAQDIVKKT